VGVDVGTRVIVEVGVGVSGRVEAGISVGDPGLLHETEVISIAIEAIILAA
jgi:hypothetical protein